MTSSIKKYLHESIKPILAACAASRAGAANRLVAGIMEIIPQVLFYTTHSFVAFVLYRAVKNQIIPVSHIVVFLSIMICIDSVGDALFFKGLWEFCAAVRRRNLVFYMTAPGPALLKILMLRWDFPCLIFGIAFGLFAILYSWFYFAVPPILILLAIILGIVTHIILTSAFHLIQVGIDPSMPLPFGSPASRFYTKPIHLLLNSGAISIVLIHIYPVYFISAFPAALATSIPLPYQYFNMFLFSLLSLGTWVTAMNKIVNKIMSNWS